MSDLWLPSQPRSISTARWLVHVVIWHPRRLSFFIVTSTAVRGHFGIAQSIRLSVPWCSCLGYRHAGCLQLSHRQPPKVCRLTTHPRMNVDPPRFLPVSNGHCLTSCTVTNLFIMNLAVADLVIIVVCLPLVSISAEVTFYTTEHVRDSYKYSFGILEDRVSLLFRVHVDDMSSV